LTDLTDRGGSLAIAPSSDLTTLANSGWEIETAHIRTAQGATRQPDKLLRVAAERRVERLLADFGVARGRRRDLVIQGCVSRAIEQWRERPGHDLCELAFAQAEETLAQWFRAVLGVEAIGEERPLLVGRAAVEICEAAGCWPGTLSTCDRLPLAAAEAMLRAGVTPTPAEEPGAMIAQALEPWSVADLVNTLRAGTLRWARSIGTGTAATP
jgi:hypothetical protein